MRILHIVYECFPGSFAGGVQKMVAELAVAQARQGDKVEIWTIGEGPTVDLEPGVCLRYFPGRARWGSIQLSRELQLNHGAFDIIHSHNTFLPLNRAAAAVARRGARVYFHAHGALDPQLLEGWNTKALKKRLYIASFERRNYDVAKGIFGLTTTECSQLELIGTKAAIYEVSNGINVSPPAPPVAVVGFRLRHRIGPHQPVILFIGRITHKKGLHYLVDALHLMQCRTPEALLVICGRREQDREYVSALDAQIARLGLDSKVRWAGFLDEEGKRAALATCDVFAHPSYSEGMAIAILEAMAAGVPTVVTPGCYMDAAVAANALALAQQSPENLAQVITELLTDKVRADQLGSTGREYVVQHHAWASVANRLAKIYSGAPEPAPHRPRVAGLS